MTPFRKNASCASLLLRNPTSVVLGYLYEKIVAMRNLTTKKCIPCEGGPSAVGAHLMAGEIEELHKQVPEWEIEDWHELKRRFKFKDFAEALLFVNKVGTLAEGEGHHPNITFGWGYAEITTYTHAVDGLSENDFILAAKIDALAS